MSLECVIIDDSLFIRETVSKMIIDAGHKIVGTFENGESFLRQLGELNPDLIFLDIILPNITGLELLEIITTRSANEKIIMLSGVAQGDAISAALRLGAIDFIQKPVSKDRLFSLLSKLSDTFEMPSVEELSTIGVSCMILTSFFEELIAHSSATLRSVIKQQISSILEDFKSNTQGMLSIDVYNALIEPDPELWGKYSEEETLEILSKMHKELCFELQFLYDEEFVNNLLDQTILTMSSRKRISLLFELVSPTVIGLPKLPSLTDPSLATVSKAGTTYDELDNAMSIAVLNVSDMGPSVVLKLNKNLLTDEEYMRNSIFFYTLVGYDDAFQEGLFGPLPVTSSLASLSSLIYSCRIEGQLILLCIYYTPVAEGIVSDYNRISFIIKTRLTNLTYVDDITKAMLRRILDDIIQYLIEN
ncbi:MAG: response regulator [Candidatus Kariarchaeaceae archaeon]|jgi:two-component system chemotaxis response regulator CheY